MIWDDRLAEIWAAPNNAGAGVVIGTAAVLTARHVVASAVDEGTVLARVVRPGAETADWVPMTVLAEDADWDVALLGVSDGNAGADDPRPRWLEPSSSSPVFVRLDNSAEYGCEAVGFPQSKVRRTPDGSLLTTVRQSERAVGTLLPAGEAKGPVNPERALPKRWIPFDVEGARPVAQAGWGGMSGAGVVLPDGRLVGLVVDAEAGRQQRLMYVVPFAEVLASSGDIAEALAVMVDGPLVMEVRDAQLWRYFLQDGCLGPEGFPFLVSEASYKAFGVKLAGVPGEPAFLNYVPRDADQKLQDRLQTAQAERRMLLVVGGSAGGRSRSAAEAARLCLPGHRLLCPRPRSLGRLHELPVADLGPALVWLDDVERYEDRVFQNTVEWLLRSGVTVVATIRRSELEIKVRKGDLRNPFGEALTDTKFVVEVAWPVIWNDQERKRVAEHVKDPALLAWVAAGKSLSAWAVAGPALQDRLQDAEADDERPARYAMVRTVLDWYRTGIGQPMPLAAATSLVQTYLPAEARPAEITDALQWALESVAGPSCLTSQSLLAEASAGYALTVHDYIHDADASATERVVSDAVWMAAMDEATSEDTRFAIGFAAARQGNIAIASKSWLLLASRGQSAAMFNLAGLAADSDPAQAQQWYERAAEAGETDAMNNLGALAADSDPAQARQWYERAAEAGNARAMFNLGALAEDSDPAQAQQWYERAAEAGETDAMNNLGALVADSDPAQARQWYERAARAGDTAAMFNLGLLLEDSDPVQAQQWYERAEAGHAGAMFHLGALAADSDPAQARQWWQRAAEAGHTRAMFNLGALAADSDPAQARQWYERAAKAGDPDAMFNLGLLLADSDPAQAGHWWQRAAEAGDTDAMNNLGALAADSDPAQARQWWQRAAEAGHTDAMFNLGALAEDSDPAQARQWYRRAAEAGHTRAMFNLGLLLADSDPTQARQWWQGAAEAGHVRAMLNLGLLVEDSDLG
jgi:TPR repeat protein